VTAGAAGRDAGSGAADLRARLTSGEVAVIGLGKSGLAASRLAEREGARVYGSDSKGEGHDLARIARASLAIVSPGVAPNAAPVEAARKAGVPVISEVELALWFLPSTRIIAVTGTNGKTTTTALIAHLLRALGADAVAAGNIGLALSEVALQPTHPAWVALEMSSFQLHDTLSLRPTVGVLTNLSPDHLDRYAGVDDYYADKDRLFLNANRESIWVTNADDVEVLRRTARVKGTHNRFSVSGLQVEARYDDAHSDLRLFDDPLIQRDQVPLIGTHNVANVLAALLAVASADHAYTTPPARERLRVGVTTFAALPHRLEIVADVGGVVWINDSKATNVASARVAIEGMTRPTIVLLGGKHKGESYASLATALGKHAKQVIAYGEAAALIEHDLGGRVPLTRLGSSFEEVMRRARALAAPGDAVLLTPACSSFDMFTNYEDRGATFRRLAGGAGTPA
jgi:UDP-N-acetylmuramoylalanine--D-glutamate ligase